ncbi:hypothetical protein AVEN_241896-1 [Araneus ventricosus]|uniref:Uncharacterized protein n=1 Tax=Araneus ventricosus TaxID=182803 RepID=A0A4Y2D0S8_ARAVE|nr:hypothetical protein AVEN_241896-1 [Araneus ventricosus]
MPPQEAIRKTERRVIEPEEERRPTEVATTWPDRRAEESQKNKEYRINECRTTEERRNRRTAEQLELSDTWYYGQERRSSEETEEQRTDDYSISTNVPQRRAENRRTKSIADCRHAAQE